jgi:hypothetical protein
MVKLTAVLSQLSKRPFLTVWTSAPLEVMLAMWVRIF